MGFITRSRVIASGSNSAAISTARKTPHRRKVHSRSGELRLDELSGGGIISITKIRALSPSRLAEPVVRLGTSASTATKGSEK